MSLYGECRMRCPFLLRFGFALHGLFGGLSLEPVPSCLCCTSACMASHLSLKHHHGEQLVLAHGESMVCARRSSDHRGCVALSSKVFLTAHATSPSLKRCRRRRALALSLLFFNQRGQCVCEMHRSSHPNDTRYLRHCPCTLLDVVAAVDATDMGLNHSSLLLLSQSCCSQLSRFSPRRKPSGVGLQCQECNTNTTRQALSKHPPSSSLQDRGSFIFWLNPSSSKQVSCKALHNADGARSMLQLACRMLNRCRSCRMAFPHAHAYIARVYLHFDAVCQHHKYN